MFFRSLNDGKDGTSLLGKTNPAGSELRLQPTRYFGLRERHVSAPNSVANRRKHCATKNRAAGLTLRTKTPTLG
jgi:hypothetical protein